MKSPRQDERRRYWILLALYDNSGPMLTSQVYSKVRELREKAGDPLTDRELKPTNVNPKEPTWINEIRHATRDLVDSGRMVRSAHGEWDITDKGRKWLDASTWLVETPIDDDPIVNDI